MNIAADLDLMREFSLAMLNGVADFLMQPPVFYIFGLIIFVGVCKGVKIIIS